MEQVLAHIAAGNLHEALVRLWVVAGRRRPDGDLVRNAWERQTQPKRCDLYVRQFRELVSAGSTVGPVRAGEEPLALVLALDAVLAEERAPRRQRSVPVDVDGEEYWLVRTPLGRLQAPAARQANNPASWFRHHHVIPATLHAFGTTVGVSVRALDRSTHRRFEALRKGISVRVYLAHFVDGVRLETQSNAAAKFFATGQSDESRRTQSVREHLEIAAHEQADFVVFPELTVTASQREEIRSWFRLTLEADGTAPILIVAGSFHERIGARQVNRAYMLGPHRDLLTHTKLRPFGLAGAEAEDITTGDQIDLLATPIGIVAMPICKDFNDVAGIDWVPMGPDWCLVPSMGDGTNVSAHRAQAERLWKVLFRTVSLVGNQEYSGPAVPGFGQSDRYQPASAGGELLVISL